MKTPMSRHPLISCVMPVCNGERYLAEAVGSILAQSEGRFELIVIDDGSTDSTPDLLRSFADADPRVRVLSRPRTGIVAALNDGIGAARAEFVARMDADDFAMPSRFARQLEYLTGNPDCVLVGSRVLMMDRKGWVIGDMVSVAHGHQTIEEALLIGGWPVVHPAVMMRRDALERIGGYREGTDPNEDHDLFLRLAEIGHLENLPDALLKYRRHLQSVTFSRTDASRQAITRIITEARQRRGQDGADWKPSSESRPAWWYRKEWVWQALREGYLGTARKHAVGVVWDRPWDKESWRAAYCAIRGR